MEIDRSASLRGSSTGAAARPPRRAAGRNRLFVPRPRRAGTARGLDGPRSSDGTPAGSRRRRPCGSPTEPRPFVIPALDGAGKCAGRPRRAGSGLRSAGGIRHSSAMLDRSRRLPPVLAALAAVFFAPSAYGQARPVVGGVLLGAGAAAVVAGLVHEPATRCPPARWRGSVSTLVVGVDHPQARTVIGSCLEWFKFAGTWHFDPPCGAVRSGRVARHGAAARDDGCCRGDCRRYRAAVGPGAPARARRRPGRPFGVGVAALVSAVSTDGARNGRQGPPRPPTGRGPGRLDGRPAKSFPGPRRGRSRRLRRAAQIAVESAVDAADGAALRRSRARPPRRAASTPWVLLPRPSTGPVAPLRRRRVSRCPARSDGAPDGGPRRGRRLTRLRRSGPDRAA